MGDYRDMGDDRRAGRVSRGEYAYRYLSDEILRGRWQAGETLSTYGLSEELGLSRTPVMGALKRLEADGLIEIIPQVGSRVAAPDPDSIEELFGVLRSLAGSAAAAASRRISNSQLAELRLITEKIEEAAQRGDRVDHDQLEQEFRALLAAASGIPQLLDATRSIATALRYRLARLPLAREQLIESAREHRDVVVAIERGTPVRARDAAERHVRRSAKRFPAPRRAEAGVVSAR
jgi:GntR family transcriptional regulator, rspAB operon transcriptional repressor